MIEGHAVCHTSAAIIAGDAEALEAEVSHQFHLILRHRSFGVCGMGAVAFRLAPVAVATQVRNDHREMRSQERSDAMPGDVRLGEPMQEQQRRAAPGGHEIDLAPARRYVSAVESFEHLCPVRLWRRNIAAPHVLMGSGQVRVAADCVKTM